MPKFQLDDISLSVPKQELGARVLSALESGYFEQDEARAMRGHFRPDDKLLDLGSETGYIATIAGRIAGGEAVTGVEALPRMVEVAKANLLQNGVDGARILWAAAVPSTHADGQVRFAARRQFWASLIMQTGKERRRQQIDVPARRSVGTTVVFRRIGTAT